MRTTLILGGVRSGKSAYALAEGGRQEGARAFVATAEALDDEMALRVERHKKERGPAWETFEEPLGIAPLLDGIAERYSIIVVDCLTLWVSNLMHAGRQLDREFAALVPVLGRGGGRIYLVSNEVGMGIVPDSPLGRDYRDALGTLNKMIAQAAARVVLMVAGIPMEVKGGGQ
jgi:adenosylcobinamide kinase/adenosylcobinamide-phosphate guanylyltransferase